MGKRLLVAAMACVVVRRLEREKTTEATTLRGLWVRWSGRQRRRGVAYTASALLAGLWSLVSMLEVLHEHSVEELRRYKEFLLGVAQEESGYTVKLC